MKKYIKINSLVLLMFFSIQCNLTLGQNISQPEQIVQQQVEAYNSHDLEAFLSFYSDSVVAYLFPDYQLGKGKEALRIEYGRQFKTSPNLKDEIKEKISFGDYVICHEATTGMAGDKTIEAVEIYKIENNLITKIWFIYK